MSAIKNFLTRIPPISWMKKSLLQNRHMTYVLQRQVRILNAEMAVARYPERVRELLGWLRPLQAAGQRKIRLGSKHDGGYVMLADFEGVKQAYSLGIDRNVSWDLEMAQRGIDVAQFDYSIRRSPADHPRFTFASKKIERVRDIDPRPGEKQILKIDIEGSEWDFLAHVQPDELARFSQIVGEFHDLDFYHNTEWWEKTRRAFQNLNATHQLVHIHSNNSGGTFWTGRAAVPVMIELGFASRALYRFEETKESFPGEHDYPCHPDLPEDLLNALARPE